MLTEVEGGLWKRNLEEEILCIVKLAGTENGLTFFDFRSTLTQNWNLGSISVKKDKFSYINGTLLVKNCKRKVRIWCLLRFPPMLCYQVSDCLGKPNLLNTES